jgi:hypothetical protein
MAPLQGEAFAMILLKNIYFACWSHCQTLDMDKILLKPNGRYPGIYQQVLKEHLEWIQGMVMPGR